MNREDTSKLLKHSLLVWLCWIVPHCRTRLTSITSILTDSITKNCNKDSDSSLPILDSITTSNISSQVCATPSQKRDWPAECCTNGFKNIMSRSSILNTSSSKMYHLSSSMNLFAQQISDRVSLEQPLIKSMFNSQYTWSHKLLPTHLILWFLIVLQVTTTRIKLLLYNKESAELKLLEKKGKKDR